MRIKHDTRGDIRHRLQRCNGYAILLLIALLSTNNVSGFHTMHRQQSLRTSTIATKYLSRIKYRSLNMNNSDDDIDNSLHSSADEIESAAKARHHSSTINSNAGPNNLQTILSTILLSLTLIFSMPLNADAGFGPSGGATTSSPPNLAIFDVQDTSAKKLKQLIGSSLNNNRLEEFNFQLDEIADTLKSVLSSEDDAGSKNYDNVSIEEREALLLKSQTKPFMDKATRQSQQAELERLQVLKQQIANQETMLIQLESQPYWFNFLAAFIGSVASTVVMHPLDTIKTRMQVSSTAKKKNVSSYDDNDKTNDEGDADGGDNIIVGYNIMGLYEGLSANLLKEGPPSAVYLGVYESVKYALLPKFGASSLLMVYLLAGAAGETCGSIIRAPAEAIKSTVQTTYCSTLEACTQVFGTSAARTNVFRAWSSSIWRDVPFGAIQLAIFELTKSYILNNPNIDFDSSTLLSEAIIGAFAGSWGALLTNPFDIITTRIITQSVIDDENNEIEPLGFVEMGMKLYDEGGLTSFLVGWQARVGYWAPGN